MSSIPAAVVGTSAPVVASSAPVVAPVVNVASSSPAYVASTPVSSSPAPAETTTSSSGSTSEGSGYGLSYSPYNADHSCKTQDQVNADFAKIGGGYSLVRTYGTDCNQTATVLTAAKAHNLKLFAGIFDLGSLSDEINLIAEAAGGDWSAIDTVSVGNELVNSGTASPTAVIAAISTVRGLLKIAGYTGKVVTVDTLVAARANPGLCDNSDYCAVNCHPFFDGTVAAKGSGDFLTTQIPTLKNVLANKNQEIVITETGWPWQGQPNGAAVPSAENQVDAISSIKSTFSSNPSGVILFTPFNDMWKSNTAAQFEAEQYWGFLGYAPSG
jgi:exo-beta-1,3-glucanase (GH17 family)